MPKKVLTLIVLSCQIVVMLLTACLTARAGPIDTHSITISSSWASATDVTYAVQFRTDPGSGWYDIGGIVVDFCLESPIIGDSCTTPAGFDLNLANLVVGNQSGITGFAVSASSDSNTVIITKNIADSF
jgi:hypothetical protein